jgi:Tfp pilus assembly protein PilF
MFGGMSRTVLKVLALMCLAGQAGAQDSTLVVDSARIVPAPVQSVASAIALRDSGDLPGAAVMLRAVLESEPDNGDAARHLAQLLYWLKDVPAATSLYEASLLKHPGDFTLRLDYGRMLVETRSDARAIEVLTPLLALPEAASRAATLIGTLRYWQGDLSRAARAFESALAADPASPEARRQLDEIRTVSAPWITLGVGGLHDDQPLDRIDGLAEVGIFLNPLTSVSAHVRALRFGFEDEQFACPGGSGPGLDGGCNTNIFIADAGVSHYLTAARLETRARGGAVMRSFGEPASEWIAQGSLRLRLTRDLSIEARGDRAPYFATESSMLLPVMTSSGSGRLALSHPRGWLGEAAFRLERFPDANTVRSAYAWSLAPVVRQEQVTLRVGYSIASQDADETRFTGTYRPYYTPENILSQSGLAHLSIRPHPRTTITARGSYAFSAREDAPTLRPGLGNPVLMFERRSFNPWEAFASLDTELSRGLTFSASIESMETAFYRASSAGVRMSYRFLPRIER